MPFHARRVVKIVCIAGAVALAGLLSAGVIYEKLGEKRDREWPPRIGSAFDVGGRTLNLSCMGEGSPTVILEIGANAPGVEWMDVQPELAKISRTCWYDRAGLGWSDLSGLPATGENVARDLHTLLAAAHVPPPYVLVGQSIGGMYIRVFTGKYPAEVAALVFVDSSQEDQLLYEPKSHASPASRLNPMLVNTIQFLSPVLYHAGLFRFLLNRFSPPQPHGDARQVAMAVLGNRPAALYSGIAGGDVWRVVPDEVRSAGNLGDRPVVVLTAGQYPKWQDANDAREEAVFDDIWANKLHASLARLSSNSKHIIVPGTTHRFASPEGRAAIVTAVRDVVNASRSKAPIAASGK